MGIITRVLNKFNILKVYEKELLGSYEVWAPTRRSKGKRFSSIVLDN